jgi:hypothetical protein
MSLRFGKVSTTSSLMSASLQMRPMRSSEMTRCAITGRERMQQTTCANASLFDHFVGGGDERRRHGEAKHPGGLVIDD